MQDILRKIYNKCFRRNRLKKLIRRGLVVGKNLSIQGEVIIDESHCWHITIGDDVTLADRVHILSHDASIKKHLNYTKVGKVKIGNRVFIGASSIILPGVTIGDDVIVGAGSVVTRDIPDRVVSAGNPARVICSLDDFLSRKKTEMEIFPCFGEEYTLRKNVTDEMKMEMNQKMKDKFGYVI
jgi:maltose O-acetyltransferase